MSDIEPFQPTAGTGKTVGGPGVSGDPVQTMNRNPTATGNARGQPSPHPRPR